MATPPEMSPDFARWYADTFMDTGGIRQLRWQGVVAASTKPSFKTIEVCIRLAFSSNVPAAGWKNEALTEAHATVVSTLAGGDASFDPSRSARELQVLAAAALSRMFASEADAAIGVVTASFAGARDPDLPMDLLGLAQKALIALSGRQHLRADPKPPQNVAKKLEFSVSADAMQSMDATLWSTELTRLRDSAGAAIATLAREHDRTINLLQRRLALDEEELQILWWLIGGFSRHLDMPFKDIDREARPLRIASELGEMTEISPGPASVSALLTRAGVGSEECTVEEAVNAVDLEWAKKVSESANVSAMTTPLHFALEKRAELGSDDMWQPGWTGLTGLKANTSMSAARMAELFYREYLFLNVGA